MNSAVTDTSDTAISTLPPHARLWVFPLKDTIEEKRAKELFQALDTFLASWDSHGAQVFGAYALSYQRFLIVAADQEASSVSGCSIDSLYRAVQDILKSNSIELADLSQVFYLDNDSVQQVSRAEFKALAASNAHTADTLVFDTSVQELGRFTSGEWILPRKNSWHEKLL